jgi:GTPase SAR1 family protein
MGYSRYGQTASATWFLQLELSDSKFVGQEEFDRLRSLSYAETHVIMICFSVDNPISLENVESKVITIVFLTFMIFDQRNSG